jgi:outer membrane receptor protein involved in Fe transport
VIDASGTPMIRSPKFSGNITGTYTEDTAIGTFDLSGTLFYSTLVYLDLSRTVRQPAYATVNANLGWKPTPTSPLRVSVWATNLTNKAYITSTVVTQSYDAANYARPRTVGGEVSYKF